MNTVLSLPLNTTPEQAGRLEALQKAFAQVCNALAPVVQQTRCWNRVALHHLTYRQLRTQFPELGSQMVCNAIYSVSRTGRLVFQHPRSPLNLERLGSRPLPQLRFADSGPVFFDRHTLSLKAGQLSMFTLDGRMRFQLSLDAQQEEAFHTQKLREIVLTRRKDGVFQLAFMLMDAAAAAGTRQAPVRELPAGMADESAEFAGDLPEYVIVEETA